VGVVARLSAGLSSVSRTSQVTNAPQATSRAAATAMPPRSIRRSEDYMAITREFPGGVVAGVRVFPVAHATWLNEDRLFLQWGELEGKAFGWLTMKSDPQDWRVAYIEPDGTALTHLEDQTFATFLRRRLKGNNSLF
jgi:hypothetical protein